MNFRYVPRITRRKQMHYLSKEEEQLYSIFRRRILEEDEFGIDESELENNFETEF